MSLIESCLSLAVISTIAMVAIPTLSRAHEQYTLTSAAQDVATKMRTARIQAIIRNRDCRLRVTSAVTYALECEIPVWAVIESVAVPKGITVSANTRPEFHPRGNVAPSGTVTVRNAAGASKRVIVNVGGRVRIQ